MSEAYPELPRIRLEQGAEYKGILPGEDQATRAVNGIFADLRDRRLLKWLFDKHEPGRAIAPGIDGIDAETQVEIAETWREILRLAYAPTVDTPP